MIPEFARKQLQLEIGNPVSLHTIQYIDGNPTQGRLVPRLVGFITEVEREFFELFCSVDGVGAKKALRAMVRPVRDVAVMIEEQDAKGLATLPGIGAATGERIIAKLRRRMSKFALMVAKETPEGNVESDVIEETFSTLRQLGHSEVEARSLIENVLQSKKRFKDTQAFLQAIYEFNRAS